MSDLLMACLLSIASHQTIAQDRWLYASFATLQALDIHSTVRALQLPGRHEVNPLAPKSVSGMIAAKAAGTAGVIALTEIVRKRSRPAAIVMMVVLNGTMVYVVQRNYRLGGKV